MSVCIRANESFVNGICKDLPENIPNEKIEEFRKELFAICDKYMGHGGISASTSETVKSKVSTAKRLFLKRNSNGE